MCDHRASTSERLILAIIALAYLGSFLLPVFDAGTPREMLGYEAFFFALISVVYLPAWLANPAFWIGCWYFATGKWIAARNMSAVAILLAFSEVWLWDEQPAIGFYLWAGSMGALVIPSSILSRYTGSHEVLADSMVRNKTISPPPSG